MSNIKVSTKTTCVFKRPRDVTRLDAKVDGSVLAVFVTRYTCSFECISAVVMLDVSLSEYVLLLAALTVKKTL